ncbi:unnamed protein product [uncultured bacterium]|nr:unnamed protein product [uncultured bacterium]
MKKFSVALVQLTHFQQEGRPMRKFLSVAIAVLLLATVTFAASAAKPKATGDADWINGPGTYNQQANTTFNAINTKAGGLDAKGSAIYTDANITYTMDVQFLRVDHNTAWFAGQVTSVTGTGCCAVGNWVFYKVTDNGEPGIDADEVWGEDLGPKASSDDAYARVSGQVNPLGGPFRLNGGNIQVH